MTAVTHLPLANLHPSPLNVRKHGPKAVDSLAASIRSIGLLQPLVVRRNHDGYEVVAGQRRLKALAKVAHDQPEAAKNEADVPCIVIGSDDEAAAIEASLAENVERLPMDELDQYTAFAALIAKGRSEDEIAASFGVTPAVVRRRLALARLIPDIHRLYRAGEIDGETLKLLTLATKERQKAYVALLRDAEANPPPRWQLKAWLLGGAEIDTRFALFDEAAYQGEIAGDLFGEARYFCDAEQFWRLQNAAIAALRDDLAAKGWTEVHVIGPEERFYPHAWEEVRKADGGHAVIEVRANGQVEITKGVVPRSEKRQRGRAAGAAVLATGDDAADGAAVDGDSVRPELSGPLANYLDLVRLSAVRAGLVAAPKVALRVLLAHLICGATHISARAEPGAAASEATAAIIAGLGSAQKVEAARTAAHATLGLDADAPLIARHPDPARTAAVLAKLIETSDADVLRLAAVLMAESLALGSDMVDVLGQTLAVDAGKHWQPDDTFFDLVRDREVASALLAEVIGERAAASYLTDTGSRKKEIIRAALAGKGREKVEGWRPRWLAFPHGAYTERKLTARPRAAA